MSWRSKMFRWWSGKHPMLVCLQNDEMFQPQAMKNVLKTQFMTFHFLMLAILQGLFPLLKVLVSRFSQIV